MRSAKTIKQVYEIIVAFGRPVCHYEIAKKLNQKSTVSPFKEHCLFKIIADLRDDNLIVEVGRFNSPAGLCLARYYEPKEGSHMGNDLVKYEKSSPPEMPADWDFAKADAEFDENIKKWRRLLFGAEEQMWFFYRVLPRKEGNPNFQPKKPTTPNGVVVPTWSEWLSNKGIGENTPIRHFKARGWLPDDKPKQLTPSGRYFITEKNLKSLIERIEGIENVLNTQSNNVLPGSWLRAEIKKVLNAICDLRPATKSLKGVKNE